MQIKLLTVKNNNYNDLFVNSVVTCRLIWLQHTILTLTNYYVMCTKISHPKSCKTSFQKLYRAK